jgi:hypothetical protein
VIAYLHRTRFIYFLSFSVDPKDTRAYFDLRRHFGVRFGDDDHPENGERADSLAWAERRGITVHEVPNV